MQFSRNEAENKGLTNEYYWKNERNTQKRPTVLEHQTGLYY
jgi:hypothetical protein